MGYDDNEEEAGDSIDYEIEEECLQNGLGELDWDSKPPFLRPDDVVIEEETEPFLPIRTRKRRRK